MLHALRVLRCVHLRYAPHATLHTTLHTHSTLTPHSLHTHSTLTHTHSTLHTHHTHSHPYTQYTHSHHSRNHSHNTQRYQSRNYTQHLTMQHHKQFPPLLIYAGRQTGEKLGKDWRVEETLKVHFSLLSFPLFLPLSYLSPLYFI